MMAFPGMLVGAAEKAGMKVPPDPDNFLAEEYLHFQVFCILQLWRPIKWGEHWENAEIIASIPEEELKTMTLEDFLDKGLHYQQ